MNNRKDLAPRLADLQRRLETGRGKTFWRSLDELADTEAFRELVRQEFPDQAPGGLDSLDRRGFLTLMGASLALAGLSGCSVKPAPSIDIVPYVRAPEEIIPGRPLFFATAMSLGGAAVGLLVENHMGRPTKIEGNPDHPASLGATTPLHQGAILGLYDPDRSQTVTYLGQTNTWDTVLGEVPLKGQRPTGDLTDVPVKSSDTLGSALLKLRARKGAGLYILTESVTRDTTLAWQLEELLKKDGPLAKAQWHQWEPLGRHTGRRGDELAFGRPVNTYFEFYDRKAKQTKAEVVLSLDCDFLASGPACLRYTADFMAGRRIRTTVEGASAAKMNRLYVVEPVVSCTGAKADHRLAMPAAVVETFARAVAAHLGIKEAGPSEGGAWERWVSAAAGNDAEKKKQLLAWPRIVAKDLEDHRGRSAVLAGERQPPVVHLIAHALNHHLENVGKTVFHTEAAEARPVDQFKSLQQLVADMDGGKVEMLLVIGANPVYTAPPDLHFRDRMQKVPLRVHLGLYQDETARECHWHLPEAHFLEAWSDGRAYDGTATIAQPLIEPIYRGRSINELLSVLASPPIEQVQEEKTAPRSSPPEPGLQTPGREILRVYWRDHWKRRGSSGDFETFWQTALHDGVIPGTLFPRESISLAQGWEKHLGQAEGGASKGEGQEIIFEADPAVYDGRFANNGWLQELPRPITRLTWGNAVLMSPTTADKLGVGLGSYAHGGEHGGFHQPVVELRLGEHTVKGPIWLVPGQADDCIVVSLGYGRDYAGKLGGSTPEGEKVGFNAYLLRTADRPWFAPGLRVNKTGTRELVACVQQHHLMEGREPVRIAAIDKYHEKPRFAHEREEEDTKNQEIGVRRPLTMYQPPPWNYDPPRNKWGMAIDLTTCIGCQSCVIACQAENNIPVVGKGQVAAGREMHWLRVDLYFSGWAVNPRGFHFQPVPCMHCENAPCEYVCPTEATVHSADGLNDMIYQRCVGTRFCSNNCPYKVRRFNFFQYAYFDTKSVRLQYNPDVTVRSRGVMEKCTYCVQRIRQAQIDSEVEKRPIKDQEILTACQAACPAEAIVFGDVNNPDSEVKRWKETPLNYSLLAELNTEPRTTYLAALRNPNRDLEPRASEEAN
jgi:MoCo/4Fe-4S cofactor protein with predicted Tat translocation signal